MQIASNHIHITHPFRRKRVLCSLYGNFPEDYRQNSGPIIIDPIIKPVPPKSVMTVPVVFEFAGKGKPLAPPDLSPDIGLSSIPIPTNPLPDDLAELLTRDTSGAVRVDHLEERIKGDVLVGLDPHERKHTIIAGMNGDGKTQIQIRLMINDIKHGAQVIWANPHLALYNEEDQQTDLRPLKDHFIQAYDYDQIEAMIIGLRAVVDSRLPLYRDNKPVGHTIVLYLDEWPGIVDRSGETIIDDVKAIAREGRKVRVYLCIASQDALVSTLGMNSGVRGQFKTVLVGTVDQHSWRALLGNGLGYEKPLSQGWWFTSQRNELQRLFLRKASEDDVRDVEKIPRRIFQEIQIVSRPHEAGVTTDHVRVARWMAIDPSISQREVARRLYPESIGVGGGGRYSIQAKAIMDMVRVLLDDRTVLPVTDSEDAGVPGLQNAVTPTEPVTVD